MGLFSDLWKITVNTFSNCECPSYAEREKIEEMGEDHYRRWRRHNAGMGKCYVCEKSTD